MIEITIKIAGECEEAVLAALSEKGFGGAAVLSAPPSVNSCICFYLEEKEWQVFNPGFSRKLKEITEIFGALPAEVSGKVLDERVWENNWKRYAKIIRIGKDLIVKPSWRTLRKKPSCPVITLDPKMAFGTGGHPSTRLCLQHLIYLKKKTHGNIGEVLDAGTGSGILAIASILSGARHVVAMDIDVTALEVARENAFLNKVNMDALEFYSRPLSDISGQFDLIFANITVQTLLDLLGAFRGHLRPSGYLVVSGILVNQGETFLKKSKNYGLEKAGIRRSGEWISYRLKKKP